MTDYVKAIKDRASPYHSEAKRLAERLRTEATITDRVIRWNSNNRVPPADCVALAAYTFLPIDIQKCDRARDTDTAAFLAEYRRNPPPVSEEMRAEARAAHGSGVTLVNVITGRKFTT